MQQLLPLKLSEKSESLHFFCDNKDVTISTLEQFIIDKSNHHLINYVANQDDINCFINNFFQCAFIITIPANIKARIKLEYCANQSLMTENLFIIAGPSSYVIIHEEEKGKGANRLRTISALMQNGATVSWHYNQINSQTNVFSSYFFHLMEKSNLNFDHTITENEKNYVTLDLLLNEPNANAHINFCHLLNKKQQIFYRTNQIHKSKKTISNLSIKGIVADNAFVDYCGKIIIENGAENSQAEQEHKTIALSDAVRITSEPILEIHTNQVKCKHGSALGKFNEEQLLYLQMRGIPLNYAQKLLAEHFLKKNDFIKNKLNSIL